MSLICSMCDYSQTIFSTVNVEEIWKTVGYFFNNVKMITVSILTLVRDKSRQTDFQFTGLDENTEIWIKQYVLNKLGSVNSTRMLRHL